MINLRKIKNRADHPEDRGRIWLWIAAQYRPSLRYIVEAAALIVIAAVFSSGDPLIVKWIVDSGIPSGRIEAVVAAGFGFLLLHVGRLICTAQSSARLGVAGQRTVQQIRIGLLERLFAGGGEFHDRHRPGALAFTLQQDIDKLTEFGGGALFSILRTGINTLILASTMITIDARLAFSVLSLVVPFFFIRRACFSRLNHISSKYQETSSRVSSALHEYIAAAHHVFLISMERFVLAKVSRLQRSRAHHERASVRTENRFGAGATLVYIAAIPVVLCGGGYQVIHGHGTIGLLMAFYAYLLKLFDPLSAMADIDTRLSRALASLERVYNLTLIEIDDRPACPANIEIDKAAPAICFERVAFGYKAGVEVLKDIDLRVDPGEKVLIAGASGSGKSTLLKLAARQYRRYDGRISYFGTSSQDWVRSRFRRLVGVAPQNSLIFECSLAENILCGRDWVSPGDLHDLLWVVALDEVASKLKHGVDTYLGSEGVRLSGGEQQRVNLARALAGRPELILLDECTSGLDGPTEYRIYERMWAFVPRSTILIASHRRVALDFCDRVVMLEQGRIVRNDAPDYTAGVQRDYGLVL